MPEKEQESKEPARVFGESMRESFASYDQATLSWKTSQLCLLEGSTLYSETWPRAGMMRSGTCCRLQPLAPHTGENGSGLWPTPRANDNDQGYRGEGSSWKGQARGETLHNAVKRDLWPTPTSRDWKGPGANGRHRDGKLQLDTLDRAVQGAEPPTGQLNPTWVEWLMGYPGGWTDSEDSATP